MNNLTEEVTEFTKVKTHFIGAYRPNAHDGAISNRSLSKDCRRGKRSHCYACGSRGHFAQDCQMGADFLNTRTPGDDSWKVSSRLHSQQPEEKNI